MLLKLQMLPESKQEEVAMLQMQASQLELEGEMSHKIKIKMLLPSNWPLKVSPKKASK